MNRKFDVLVVGELNIDLILNKMDGMPSIGKEVLAGQMTLTLGSSAAIFASNLQTIGRSITYIGRLGNDIFGDFTFQQLYQKGIDTQYIIRSDAHNTGASIILNMAEDRAMITHTGAMSYLTIHDIPDAALSSAKHLHISSIFLQTGILPDLINLLKKARNLGLTTSIDPQWDPAEKWDLNLDEIMKHLDIFLPNMAELMAITGISEPNLAIEYIKKYKNIVIIKDGRNGAILWDGNEILTQKAYLNHNVADAIGAGDSFDAGFISKFLEKKTLSDCLDYANLMGAINTTMPGGTSAFSSFETVKIIAKNQFNTQI